MEKGRHFNKTALGGWIRSKRISGVALLYDELAETYAAGRHLFNITPILADFARDLPVGAHILDAGDLLPEDHMQAVRPGGRLSTAWSRLPVKSAMKCLWGSQIGQFIGSAGPAQNRVAVRKAAKPLNQLAFGQ